MTTGEGMVANGWDCGETDDEIGGKKAGVLALVIAGAMTAAAPALAQQALESHPVPVDVPQSSAIRIDAANYGSDDRRPFGVNLAGVTLIGETDAVLTRPPSGIVAARAPVPEGKEAIHPALVSALSPFLGKPLSPHEIAALQAEVASVYRKFGLPFTSVTVPPQEITSGVLQMRVIAFRAGAVKVEGTGQAPLPDAAQIAEGVRLRPGQTVDARALSEDIDWLNRNPYRYVGAVFSPGDATGLTDLSLRVSESRPWSLTLGWSNGGSKATGVQRYSFGGGSWLPAFNGTTLSYLLTVGGDVLQNPNRIVLKDGDYPQYLSQAARIVIPTGARQQLEFTPDLVATRQVLGSSVSVQNFAFELPVTYRIAVSNILPGQYWGDIYGGVTLKGLRRAVFAGDVKAGSSRTGLMQFTLGWSNTISGRHGETGLDLSIVANPGGMVANSDDAAWSAYSNGRVTSASYAYGVLNVTRRTSLDSIFGKKGFSWESQFTGLLAGTALPETEQLALGGSVGSRGYGFSDVAVDRGAIWRNELHFPELTPPADLGASVHLLPYLLADAAWGQTLNPKSSDTLISLGAGIDIAIGDKLVGGITAARAMTDTGSVKAGSWNVLGNLTFKY